MKKTTKPFLIFVGILLILVVGSLQFPKYTMRFSFLGFFLIIEALYWLVFRSFSKLRKRTLKIALNFVYWTPLTLMALFFLLSIISPIQNWPPVLKIYFPGLLVTLIFGKFILLSVMLIGDLIFLPFNLFHLARKKSWIWLRYTFFIKTGLLLNAIAILVLIYGMIFPVYEFKIHKIEIANKKVPPGFDGLKIVQLSDIHLGSWISKRPLERAENMVEDMKPDLVLFTGDLVNYSTDEAFRFESLLKNVNAPLGVYAILGNHDYGDYVKWKTPGSKVKNDKDLFDFYERIGWRLLKNEHLYLHKDKDSILLIGVENWSTNKNWGRRGDLEKATRGVDTNDFSILLSHDPTYWRAGVLKGYRYINLTLSGHTHAMQIGCETSWCRWSPAEWIFTEWAGLYQSNTGRDKTQLLYVNRGLGHLGYPGRLGIRPEITLITLKRRN